MSTIVPKTTPTRNLDTRTLAELHAEHSALIDHLVILFERERDHDHSVGPAIDKANRQLDEVQTEIDMRRYAASRALDGLTTEAKE